MALSNLPSPTPTIHLNSSYSNGIPNASSSSRHQDWFPITGRQYENVSVPLWNFNSTCVWIAAAYADLAISGAGLVFNAFIFSLPFFFRRLYNIRGGLMCSYTAGAVIAALCWVYFDLRALVSPDCVTDGEKSVVYVMVVFLANHFFLHLFLLTWNQQGLIMRLKSHLRYADHTRLVTFSFMVWLSSTALAIMEAYFTNNLAGFPFNPLLPRFRLVCLLILVGFFWILPLLVTVSRNGDIFCFLLKLIQNGYVVHEVVKENRPEMIPTFAAKPLENDEGEGSPPNQEEDEDEPELPTMPEDVSSEFAECFAQIVITSVFGMTILPWLAYHTLAMFRAGDVLEGYRFYEIIFNCHTYIILYVSAKVIPLLNPLGFFYYRAEVRQVLRRGGTLWELHA